MARTQKSATEKNSNSNAEAHLSLCLHLFKSTTLASDQY